MTEMIFPVTTGTAQSGIGIAEPLGIQTPPSNLIPMGNPRPYAVEKPAKFYAEERKTFPSRAV